MSGLRDDAIDWARQRHAVEAVELTGFAGESDGLVAATVDLVEVSQFGYAAAQFAAIGNQIRHNMAVPSHWDLEHPIGLTLQFVTGSATADDGVTFIGRYDAIGIGDALATPVRIPESRRGTLAVAAGVGTLTVTTAGTGIFPALRVGDIVTLVGSTGAGNSALVVTAASAEIAESATGTVTVAGGTAEGTTRAITVLRPHSGTQALDTPWKEYELPTGVAAWNLHEIGRAQIAGGKLKKGGRLILDIEMDATDVDLTAEGIYLLALVFDFLPKHTFGAGVDLDRAFYFSHRNE